MKNNYKFDIDKNLNEEIKIPDSIIMKKKKAFDMIKREKKNRRNKRAIAACVAISIIMFCSVNFADDVSAYIKEMFFRNNVGAQIAIDNGYIENIEDSVMKDKGVEIKLDKFLIDDSRAVISMKINFEDNNIKDIITGLKVESKLLCDGKEIANSAKHEFTIDEVSKEITYNTVFGLENKVEVDELTLNINGLDLFTDLKSDVEWDERLSEEDKKSISEANIKIFDFIEGNWITNIKIDDKFKNPKVIPYKHSEENNEIEIISANVTPTGMDIKFAYKNENEGAIIPEKVRKSLYDMKITNAEGKEIKCDGFLSSHLTEENKSTFTKTFYITSFDCEDSYTLEVMDLNGSIQKVKLVK